MTINPLDVMQMEKWAAEVDENDRDRILGRLKAAEREAAETQQRAVQMVQELQDQRDDLRDSRDTWRAWCLLLGGAMLLSIAWGTISLTWGCILWGR